MPHIASLVARLAHVGARTLVLGLLYTLYSSAVASFFLLSLLFFLPFFTVDIVLDVAKILVLLLFFYVYFYFYFTC